MVTIIIPGACVPCPRPRVNVNRGPVRPPAHYPARYVEWIREAGWLAKAAWRKPPLATPVAVSVTFRGPHKRADIDNLLKSVLDALTGIVYVDDRQVVEVEALIVPALPSVDQYGAKQQRAETKITVRAPGFRCAPEAVDARPVGARE